MASASACTLHTYAARDSARISSAAPPSATALLLPKRKARISRVRCQTDQERPPETTSETVKSPPQPVHAPPPVVTPMPKESTSIFDILAFSGPGPERINGRMAMVGFVSAIAVELARGDDLVSQLADGGVPWLVGTAALLSAASLVPLLKGVSAQSRSDGVMTADAELWNGRFAMLGLAALAFTEYLKGGPLV